MLTDRITIYVPSTKDGNAYEYGVYFCKLGYRSEARFLCGAIRRAAVEMMGKIEDMQEENQ